MFQERIVFRIDTELDWLRVFYKARQMQGGWFLDFHKIAPWAC